MKTVSAELAAYLEEIQSSPDACMFTATIYEVVLQIGRTIRVTSADADLTVNGDVYSADSIMFHNLLYKSTIGLDADHQNVTVLYRETDKIGGITFAAACANGILAGATIKMWEVYYRDYVGGDYVGDVLMYSGRILSVESCGSVSAEITVGNSLVVLENDMPRNVYSATCNHTLYDSGCGLNRADFMVETEVGAGSNLRYIFTPAAAAAMIGGYLEFITGPCTGLRATVKNVTNGVLVELLFSAPQLPEEGDTVRIYQGCDRIHTTCRDKFSNLPNFRGYSYVPPPSSAQ